MPTPEEHKIALLQMMLDNKEILTANLRGNSVDHQRQLRVYMSL